jgi:hypothetical protein
MNELEKIREIRNLILDFTKAPTKDMFDQGFKYGMLYAMSIIEQYYPIDILIPVENFNFAPEPPTLNE